MGIVTIPWQRHVEEVPTYTPEAAEAVERLEALERSGWDLMRMTAEELDGIDADMSVIVHGRSEAEQQMGSYTGGLLHRAHEAVGAERVRRDLERQRVMAEQRSRIDHVRRAAGYLDSAQGELEQFENIEDKGFLLSPSPVDPLTRERLHAMTDKELASAEFVASMAEKQSGNSLREFEHSADVLEKHGGARGKRAAKVLRGLAKESRTTLEAHRSNASAARAEIKERAERVKRDEEARASLPRTTATVEELLVRVADLEEKLAANAQQVD